MAVLSCRLAPQRWLGHRVTMAIRMREWGLKAYPNQAVQVPLSGINGMDESARAIGRGLTEMAAVGAESAELYDRVQEQGVHTRLATALEQAVEGAREQLNKSRDPEDWNRTWEQSISPAVEQVLDTLPESRRERARGMADTMMQRAALEAQRDAELARVAESRRLWQNRVEEAVKRGDSAAAEARLEEGRDVYVPQGEMEQRRAALRSRCCAGAWSQALQQNPLTALGDWSEGRGERPEKADAEAVQQEMSQARRDIRRRLGAEFAEGLHRGVAPAESVVQEARRAGLLESDEMRLPHHDTFADSDALDWMRRADACEDDDDSVADMQLRLATLNTEPTRRRRLLQYFEDGRRVPHETRRDISTAVWNLYRSGRLGCMGDSMAVQRAAALMQEGRRLLHPQDGKADAEAWQQRLSALRDRKPVWVCFEQA